ncbi:MAG: peptidyl-prolyl cis-trans isomerase [Clostridiales bacterium]|nr:peptidyl-prolyl cis-trans isomerase [Clostridiales bacterium]
MGKKRRNYKRLIAFAAAGLLMLACALAAVYSIRERWNSKFVEIVNNYGVTPQEFEIWSRAYAKEGDTLQNNLKAMALVKLTQIEGRRAGLIEFVDYEGFLESLALENERRAQIVNSGGVVYGVTEFDEINYYTYMISNLRFGLIPRLTDDGIIDMSDGPLRAFYDAHKDEYALAQDIVELNNIYFHITEKGVAELEAIEKRLENGEDFSSIFLECSANASEELLYTETLTIDEENAYELMKYESTLFDAANALTPGEWTVIADDMNGACMLLVFCVNKAPGGYKTFEEAEAEIRQAYVNAAFDAYLEDLYERAAIYVRPD